jgi:hypothetical protein
MTGLLRADSQPAGGGAISGPFLGAEKFFVRPPCAPKFFALQKTFPLPPIGAFTFTGGAPCYRFLKTRSPVRVLCWVPPALQSFLQSKKLFRYPPIGAFTFTGGEPACAGEVLPFSKNTLNVSRAFRGAPCALKLFAKQKTFPLPLNGVLVALLGGHHVTGVQKHAQCFACLPGCPLRSKAFCKAKNFSTTPQSVPLRLLGGTRLRGGGVTIF